MSSYRLISEQEVRMEKNKLLKKRMEMLKKRSEMLKEMGMDYVTD